MPRTKRDQATDKGQYDHILLMWAVLLGGGIFLATTLGYIQPDWGLPLAVLFGFGFLALWLLSPALHREKKLTHFSPEPSSKATEISAQEPSQQERAAAEDAGHPLTQATPVLIIDEAQLLDFIAQNPHPQTGQFSAIVKEMQKKD